MPIIPNYFRNLDVKNAPPKITVDGPTDVVADDGTITRTTITTRIETITPVQQQLEADAIQAQIDTLTAKLTPLQNTLSKKITPINKM